MLRGSHRPGKSLSEACAREVLEETGVRVRIGRLIAVYTSPHTLLEYADGNRLQIVVLHFLAEPVGGSLNPSDEAFEVGYLSQSEIEHLDIGDWNRQRIDDAFAEGHAVFVREDLFL